MLLAYFLIRCVYNLFLSPLSSIPGPWYAAISDLWISVHVLRLRQCKVIDQLFQEYGPVVRVGPKKVVFRDCTAMRDVYTVYKFDKSSYYQSLLTNDNDHAMTTLDHAKHVARRKGYAVHYSPSNVVKFQSELHEVLSELVNTLDSVSGKSPLECLALFRQLMVDVIVSSSYGYRLGAVRKWAVDVEDPLSTAISDFPKRGILRSIVPAWAWKIVCRIPNKRWRMLCDSDRIMAEFVSARVYEMRSEMNAGGPQITVGDLEKMPMLQRLLQHRSSASQLMSDQDIISECMGHMIAASDTTSTSLSYFFWELSRRPDISKRLQMELDEAMPESRVLPELQTLQELPYLNAFIKEGLRLYGAAPSLLERVVPDRVQRQDGVCAPYDLMGFELPPGTIVGTQAWSMHRDKSLFPFPETFMPDRWLNQKPEVLSRMMQHMIPFGTGTRMCGGHHLAQAMLKLSVAAISRNFNVIAPTKTDERSMEMKDSFVMFPASMECNLVFTPRLL
ncbi:cytochrome P450 [Cyathus striatus]|nr:cytochrome P450 [Cyathus striatus]